jgi:hypothetical protein
LYLTQVCNRAIALLAIVVARAVWPPSRGAGAHSTVASRRMQPWANIRTVYGQEDQVNL